MQAERTERIQLGGHQHGRSPQAWSLVDADDYEFLSQWNWSIVNGYAARLDKSAGRLVLMHRVILGLVPGDGLHADHINRDKIDNRRANLRVVTHRQNCQNMPVRRTSTSGFRGVRRSRDRWQAYATLNGKFHHLGVYATPEEASEVARLFREQSMPWATD